MKNKALLILSIVMAICLLTSAAAAQSGGNYTITQSVIAGGGGTSAGSPYSITGTTGQPAAGTVSSGGNYSVAGGFWSAAPLGTITVSGQITSGGSPVQGVTVSMSGSANGDAVTDVNGNYGFQNVIAGGTFTITPSLAGYVFSPASASFGVPETNTDINQNFIATQCTYALTPTSVNPGAAASTGSFTVTAPAGCAWTANSSVGWLMVTSGSPGSGNGTVNYSIAANSGPARSGTITVGGQTFTVNQALGHSISGTIIYGTGSGKLVPGVTLTAVGPNTITASSAFSPAGNYTLEGLTDGVTYVVTPTKTGHVSGITAFDATLVLRCVAAGQANCTLTTNQRKAADSDNDTQVTAFDATQILRYVAANSANQNTGLTAVWKFELPNRTYSNLTTNPTGQDYTAFLIGDVDGDWTQPQSLADEAQWQPEMENLNFSSEKEADDATAIRVSLSREIPSTKSATILIPVMLSNKTGRDISSFALDVRYDAALLQIDDDNPVVLTDTLGETGNFAVVSDTGTPGRIGIAAGAGSLFNKPAGTLLNLRFKVIGERGVAKKRMSVSVNRASFQDQEGIQIMANGANP